MQTGHTDKVLSTNFSPDGKQIVSASWDKSLKLWDLAGNCLQTFVGHSGLKFALATPAVCPTKVCRQLPAKSQSLRLLSPEAETICLPSGLKLQLDWHIYEAQCKVNAVKSIAELKVLGFMQTGHTDKVLSTNFSPDGKQIVSRPQPYAQQKFADNYPLNPKV
jgi:WD40 repeat protein